jgi:hypothetical protein
MTFIIESTKGDRHTIDIRSSGSVAVTLALRLLADGFAVSIKSPSGRSYSADQFDLLLAGGSLDSQEIANDG